MLCEVCDESLIRLGIKASHWEEAIRKAAAPLVEQGKAKAAYVDDMIVGVKENGPYIVLAKHIALPHARPESGAMQDAIGIATLAQPVAFGSKDNDPVKYLFCLSATNDMGHLQALAQLAELFEDQAFFQMLDSAKDAKEVMAYLNKRIGGNTYV